MERVRCLLVCAASVLLCAGAVKADDSPPPFSAEIVVTADRGDERRDELTSSVTVLTARDLARLPVRTLAEALQFAPGLTVNLATEGAGRPIVASRGFFGGGEVEYLKLLVDGVPTGDPETSLINWRLIDAGDIERIEIVRGPGSPLYGDASIGGVVQVFTRETGGAVSVEAGTASRRGIGASYRVGIGSMMLSASARAVDGDGWRDRAGEATRTASLSLSGAAWRLSLSGDSIERDDPGPLPLDVARVDPRRSESLYQFDHEATEHRRAAISGHRVTAGILLEGTGYVERRSTTLLRSILIVPAFGERALRALDTTSGGASVGATRAWSWRGREGETRGGIDVDRATLTSDYFAVAADGMAGALRSRLEPSRRKLGVYLLEEWHPADGVRVSAAMRRDEIRDRSGAATTTRSAWSPRLGVSAARGPYSMWIQYARAFRAATLDQLFDARSFPDFRGGRLTISNPALEPERTRSVELGAARAAGGWRCEAVAYEARVTNEIDFDPATFRYRNIGQSRHRGVELSLTGDAGRVHPLMTYAWTQVESLGDGGHPLKNIPEHSLRIGGAADLPLALRGIASWSLARGRFLDDGGRFPLADSRTLDLGLRRDFGRLALSVDLLNALDSRNQELGFVLPDFRGGAVPYVYPATGRLARVVAGWKL